MLLMLLKLHLFPTRHISFIFIYTYTAQKCKETTESIDKVSLKITEEDEELSGKEEENVDLTSKLETFKAHLEARRARDENEKR